jgi:hypothetical protein
MEGFILLEYFPYIFYLSQNIALIKQNREKIKTNGRRKEEIIQQSKPPFCLLHLLINNIKGLKN